MTPGAPRQNAGVYFPPPLLYVGGLVVGWLLDTFVYRLPLPYARHLPVHLAGVLVAVLGVALMASGALTFRAHRTAIIPHKPASSLVDTGPYRFTRNPMYTGLAIAYLGVATVVGSIWPFLLLPIVLLLVTTLVIAREEAYLTDAFGAEYAAYRARVRRWL